MSINFVFTGVSGVSYVTTIQRISDGYYRDSSSESFLAAPTFAQKSITLSGGVAENTSSYTKTFDASAWQNGLYLSRVHDLSQGNKTMATNLFNVINGNEISVGNETLVTDVYHADIQFIRDSENLIDEYTVTWFKNGVRVVSGIQSPLLQVFKRSDGTDLVPPNTMDFIGNTGSCKFDVTVLAQRQSLGDSYLVVASSVIDQGNRGFSWILGRDG